MVVYKKESKAWRFWDYICFFTRFWGVVSAVVTCGVGADDFAHHRATGLCTVLGSFIILFLELTWAITLFLKASVQNDHSKIFNIWNIVLHINNWKKTFLYFLFSVILLLNSHGLWLSFVAGAMLVVLGLLHLVLSFNPEKNKLKEAKGMRDGTPARNEEIFEVLDNSLKIKEGITIDEPGGNVLEI